MSDIPVPLSYSELFGRAIDRFVARSGISRLRVGSGPLSIIEAAVQNDLRVSQDIFTFLKSSDLNNSSGIALLRLGQSENVAYLGETPAFGYVTISDTSFTKLSSTIYQGLAAPFIGSTSINVVDASTWPASGSIYIGRNTSNFEGPLTYTSITNNVSYYTINLSTPTVKYHNLNEIVTVAQGGDRTISINTIVQTPLGSVSESNKFRIVYPVTIPDGEVSIENVLVICTKPGIGGNVTSGSIKEFASSPFAGASVTNPLPFSNGRATESEEDYRDRIRNAKATRSKGTPLAVLSSVIGVNSTEENKTIISSTLVTNSGDPSILYIDDGSGYEEKTSGIGVESLVDSAQGGEHVFKLSTRPIVKARISTTLSSPFELFDGYTLSFVVNGVESSHTFSSVNFRLITSADAYEVVSDVNSDFNIKWSARTVDNGTKIVFSAKTETNESIYWVETEENPLGLTTTEMETVFLYKNDRLLFKDGLQASILGSDFTTWNPFTGNQTLTIEVDGTPSVTYTFTDQNFIDAETGYTTVAPNSLEAWATVINKKIPGVTCSVVSNSLYLVSNLGASDRASLKITGGSLISANVFDVITAVGFAKDYSLDRSTGEIKLTSPLVAGDKLSAGSLNARAFIQSASVAVQNLASTGYLWFIGDGNATTVSTTVSGSTPLTLSIPKVSYWGYRLRASTSSSNFSSVQTNDWAILWDSNLDSSIKNTAHRIIGATSSSFDVERTNMLGGHKNGAFVKLNDGRVMAIGGQTGYPNLTTNSCEIYDPATKLWTSVASLNTARASFSACVLTNNKVLVVGGIGGPTNVLLDSCELYDPSLNTWSAAATYPSVVSNVEVIGLNSGNAIALGGLTTGSVYLGTSYVYNTGANTWSANVPLNTPRAYHSVIKLNSGDILTVGGETTAGALTNTAEKYNGVNWTATANNISSSRALGMIAKRSDGNIIYAGGTTTVVSSQTPTTATDIYNTGTNTWSAGNALANACCGGSFVITTNGNGIVAFGNRATPSNYFDTFNGGTNAYTLGVTQPAGQLIRQQVFGCEIATNQALFCGGYEGVGASGLPDYTTEQYSVTGASWSQQDPSLVTNLNLTGKTINFARSNELVNEVTIPSGSSYTASSFTNEINTDLINKSSLEAYTYKTDKIRVRTNTFDKDGDISLIAVNTEGQKTNLTVSNYVKNLTGHQGSVEAGNPYTGTPSFFQFNVSESLSKNIISVNSDILALNPKYTVVGLKPDVDTLSLLNYSSNTKHLSTISSIINNICSTTTAINKLTLRTGALTSWFNNDRLYLANPYSISANDTFGITIDEDTASKRYVMNMWRALKPTSSNYTVSNSFKDRDNSNSSLAVTFGYGPNGTDFNDFAAFMKARVKSHSADLTKAVLWRYYRFGPDGNNAKVRYVLPTVPDAPVAVTVNNSTDIYSYISIGLASGSLRTGYLLPSGNSIGTVCTNKTNNIGDVKYVLGLQVATAQRTTNVVTLTLTLPAGVTAHGIANGSVIYLNSTDVNIPTGSYTVVGGNGTTTITFNHTAADYGPVASIGDVSLGLGRATTSGGSVIVGDILYVNTASGISSNFEGKSVRIASLPNPQIIQGYLEEYAPAPNTTISWNPINDANYFTIFANANQTASQISTAVNALNSVSNTTCPISGTILGNGTGVISQSTAEFEGTAPYYYQLVDGVNWIKTTTVPGSVVGDYTLDFKNSVNSGLATDSDWINEEIRIVPITANNLITWFKSLAVSGLSSVSSIQTCKNNTRPQIVTNTVGSLGSVRVDGGTANSVSANVVGSIAEISGQNLGIVTIPTSQAGGIVADSWISIDNSIAVSKPRFDSNLAFDYIGSNGIMHLSNNTFYTTVGSKTVNAICYFEKHGNYICIHGDALLGSQFSLSSVKAGNRVRISAPISPTIGYSTASQVNQGIYTVVAVKTNAVARSNAIWIENSNAIEEGPVVCDVHFLDYESSEVGDTLSIGTDLLGIGNHGNWTVAGVGSAVATATIGSISRSGSTVTVITSTPHYLTTNDYVTLTPGEINFASGTKQITVVNTTTFTYTEAGVATTNVLPQTITGYPYQNNTIINVNVNSTSVSPLGVNTALGTSYALIQLIEGLPSRRIKYVHSIIPNSSDGAYTELKIPFGDGELISANNGSVISVLDKLNFTTSIARGIDGYTYDTGLLQEANKVLQGLPENPSAYPGVVAVGSQVIPAAPLIKRIKIAVAVRLFRGVTQDSVAANIRSVIASLINAFPHGESIPISDIVAAVETVDGVDSVVVTYPAYDSQNDLIVVQSYERPKVLDLNQDITITFIS